MVSPNISKAFCNYCGKPFLVGESKKENEEQSIQNLLILADNATRSSIYDEAEKYYSKALKIDSHNYLVWFGLAKVMCLSSSFPSDIFLSEDNAWIAYDLLQKIGELKFHLYQTKKYSPQNIVDESIMNADNMILVEMGKYANKIIIRWTRYFGNDHRDKSLDRKLKAIFIQEITRFANQFIEVLDEYLLHAKIQPIVNEALKDMRYLCGLVFPEVIYQTRIDFENGLFEQFMDTETQNLIRLDDRFEELLLKE